MSVNHPPASEKASGSFVAEVLGDERQTKKVLSSLRLKVAFMVFVSALLSSQSPPAASAAPSGP